jgi:hypothetical protein
MLNRYFSKLHKFIQSCPHKIYLILEFLQSAILLTEHVIQINSLLRINNGH